MRRLSQFRKFSRFYSEFSETSTIKGFRKNDTLREMQKVKISPPKIEKSFSTIDLKTPLNDSNPHCIEPITHFRDSDVKITTLSNGLRVATLDTHSNSSNITILFRAGARYESDDEKGLSVIINKLSFLESENFTHEELERAKDKVIYESEIDAEITNFHITFFRDNVESAVSLISDTILRPMFHESRVEQIKEGLAMHLEDQLENPVMTAVATNQLYQSCFGSSDLGKNQLHFNRDAHRGQLLKFLKKYYRPERCVVVGLNVVHDPFMKLIEKYFRFENVSSYDKIDSPSKWHGGDARYEYIEAPNQVMKQNMPALTSVALSFKGYSASHKDIYATHVLESILGGGDSFSAGGPGKGLSSIIHTKYLTQFDFFSMKCEHKALYDAGMFTLSASATHDKAEELLHPLVHLATNMIKPGFIKESDLMSGKNRFKSVILGVLEDLNGLATNLAYDMMYLGHPRSGYELCKHIDAVTMDDLHRLGKEMIATPPAVSVIGDISKVAQYPIIQKYFKELSSSSK